MKFDEGFDRIKSQITKERRGIDFVEAREVFADLTEVIGPGTMKDGEERWLRVGMAMGKLWTVGFTLRPDGIRIFMVRPARDEERDAYYG